MVCAQGSGQFGYQARGCGPCELWIEGLLGMGFSGTQLWGLQWYYDSGGLLRQHVAFVWYKGIHHFVPGISLFKTIKEI